jgi:hypothetical protein
VGLVPFGGDGRWMVGYNRRVDLIEFYAIVRALGGDPEAVIVPILGQPPKKVAI